MTNSMFNNESRSDNEEENVVFHYSHEHRIKNAPKEVQDYYNGNFELNKGIKVLFKNKSNRFLLIALVIMTVFALIYSRINSSRYKGTVSGYNAELEGISFQDKVFAVLKFSEIEKKKNSERQPVIMECEFRFYDVNNQLAEVKKESRLMEKSEIKIETSVSDYDFVEVEVDISAGNEKKTLGTRIKR